MSSKHGFYRAFVAVHIIFLVTAAGCAKPPTEEMIKAEKAIERAKQKEAHIYAEDIFQKAKDSFRNAKELVAARKYEEAKSEAGKARRFAGQAITLSDLNRATLADETSSMVEDVRETIDEMRSFPPGAFRKKALIGYERLQTMIGTWEAGLVTVGDTLRKGQVWKAHEGAAAIRNEVDEKRGDILASLKKRKGSAWK